MELPGLAAILPTATGEFSRGQGRSMAMAPAAEATQGVKQERRMTLMAVAVDVEDWKHF